MQPADLSARVLAGDVRAVARAISVVEDGEAGATTMLAAIHSHAGRATVVGVTGPPGSGKSTLVGQLIAGYRKTGARVAVIAVDPSSPFTGGALLGDRIRMQRHAGDDGVFIRSLASRGHLGGVTGSTADVITVFDAAGFDPILVETVGVGQAEVDVARLADTTVVVVAPGAGDDVQALKAGVMEAADVFVVNKADRAGADDVVAAIDGLLSLVSAPPDGWRPPILSTVATSGEGLVALLDAIARHGRADPQARAARRRVRHLAHLRALVIGRLMARLPESRLERVAEQTGARTTDPYSAADRLAAEVIPSVPAWLDHVGVATTSLSEVVSFLRDQLGGVSGEVEEVAAQQVRVQFVWGVGGSDQAAIELIEPTSADSTLARFLATRGPGLHHIAVRVDHLDAVLDTLRTRGVRLVDQQPKTGARGRRVAFIHPHATHGVLIELVEIDGESRAGR